MVSLKELQDMAQDVKEVSKQHELPKRSIIIGRKHFKKIKRQVRWMMFKRKVRSIFGK